MASAHRPLALAVSLGVIVAPHLARAQPDFAITEFTATPTDRSVHYSVTVCNNGDQAPGVGPAVVVFPRTMSPPICNVGSGMGVGFPRLQPGACHTQTSYRDDNVPVGPGASWVMADHLCSIPEKDEGNNTKQVSYTVAAPDLYVNRIWITPEGFPNPSLQNVKINTEICNQGTSAVIGHHAAIITHSETRPADCVDYGSMTGGTVKLGAGKCYTQSRTEYVGTSGGRIPPGSYRSWIIADTTCKSEDGSRANNTASLDWTIAGDGTVTMGNTMVAGGDAGMSSGDAGVSPPDAATCQGGAMCMCGSAFAAGGSASISGGFDLKMDRCPVVDDKFEVGLTFSGTVTADKTGCPDCKSSSSAETKLAGALNICGAFGFAAEGIATMGYDRQFCTNCDQATCALTCDQGRYCSIERTGGAIKVGISKFYGTRIRKRARWAKLAAVCGVTVGGSFGGKAMFEETRNNNACSACAQCEKATTEFILGLSGEGGCAATVTVGKVSGTVGCSKCGTLALDFTHGDSEQKGACGPMGCGYAKITGKAALATPPLCAGASWFRVAARCAGEATGESVRDTCNGNSFKAATKLTCAVQAGREAKMLCEDFKK